MRPRARPGGHGASCRRPSKRIARRTVSRRPRGRHARSVSLVLTWHARSVSLVLTWHARSVSLVLTWYARSVSLVLTWCGPPQPHAQRHSIARWPLRAMRPGYRPPVCEQGCEPSASRAGRRGAARNWMERDHRCLSAEPARLCWALYWAHCAHSTRRMRRWPWRGRLRRAQ
jgi:hypothetical protein